MGLLYCEVHGQPLAWSPTERVMACTVDGCESISYDGKAVASRTVVLMRSHCVAVARLLQNESSIKRRELGSSWSVWCQNEGKFLQFASDALRGSGVEQDERRLRARVLMIDGLFGWPGEGSIDATSMRMRMVWCRDRLKLGTNRFYLFRGRVIAREWLCADDACRIPVLGPFGGGEIVYAYDHVMLGFRESDDHFQVCDFTTQANSLFRLDESVAACPERWRKVRRYVTAAALCKYLQFENMIEARFSPSVVASMRGSVFVLPNDKKTIPETLTVFDSLKSKPEVLSFGSALREMSRWTVRNGLVFARPASAGKERHMLAVIENLASNGPASRSKDVVVPSAASAPVGRSVGGSRKFRV